MNDTLFSIVSSGGISHVTVRSDVGFLIGFFIFVGALFFFNGIKEIIEDTKSFVSSRLTGIRGKPL